MILGIESTCDETAAALVADGYDVRSNVVATQVELHAKYRGVVPEIASRAHIENILPVLREAMQQAGATWDQIDAIAVAHRPGLIGSLLIGVTAAKTLAWALDKPLVGVDHVHAHLYSVVLETNRQPPMPAVGLVCSGGHTALYAVRNWLDVQLIGSTIDDAVGEAYDKVAALLGLGYPGGPILDRLAAEGDPKAVHFPRTLLGRDSLDFSFSGLKTAVLYHVRGVPRRGENVKAEERKPTLTDQELKNIAAGFQQACVDVLCRKLERAARKIKARSVIIGGGVSANQGLRAALAKFPVPVFFPPMKYCTDNAAMSAALAQIHLRAGRSSGLELDAITSSQFAL
ncbi:MAG TPA: tRNA (adenosine(37)-N6)-threonylcarbamoyltransferase complex transferase subunit TsaD [Tepidisphaeraceae bacterium]|jgi:N6-L-threonylcarbamoyladenine synthase|nr:tRNA (adenosine(37)-N6)-threonylcarbamoyltransferase complex transferase subunit TsaD [Tepidisphaeraceae bacterium]